MATATKEEIAQAVEIYIRKHPGVTSDYDEATDSHLMKDTEKGLEVVLGPKMACTSKDVEDEIRLIIAECRETCPQEPTRSPRTEARQEKAIMPMKARNGQGGQLVKAPARDVQVSDLTMDDIKAYICPDATEQEAFMFLKLCQARNLNPFTMEAYLVKYGGKANMIVGKEAFTRKAEQHPQFDGFKAGILVKEGDHWIEREGSFLMQGEELLGGFAEVYRKDRKLPFKAMVGLKEYSKAQATWKDMPCVMIRKVALVSALREAFPSDLSGCYDVSEIEQGAA